jgi:hypothetical protein
MAHKAGTGDAPIPGLITSRRNPAYRLKQKPKEPTPPGPKAKAAKAKRWDALSQRDQNPSHRGQKAREAPLPKRPRESSSASRSPEAPRQAVAVAAAGEEAAESKRHEERPKRAEAEEAARLRRTLESEARQKKALEEQEAKWAEERAKREEQRRLEEQRRAQRQQKLRGAFATGSDSDDGADAKGRARELAELQKKKAQAIQANAPFLSVSDTASSADKPLPGERILSADEKADAIRLRAALADPAASRSHAPGEVAEQFRLLAEMKRKFRRPEFGGPASRDRSRSRSRTKYNSVWIRPGEKR